MEIKCGEEFEGFLVLSAVALGVMSQLVVGTLGDAIGVTVVGTGGLSVNIPIIRGFVQGTYPSHPRYF